MWLEQQVVDCLVSPSSPICGPVWCAAIRSVALLSSFGCRLSLARCFSRPRRPCTPRCAPYSTCVCSDSLLSVDTHTVLFCSLYVGRIVARREDHFMTHAFVLLAIAFLVAVESVVLLARRPAMMKRTRISVPLACRRTSLLTPRE